MELRWQEGELSGVRRGGDNQVFYHSARGTGGTFFTGYAVNFVSTYITRLSVITNIDKMSYKVTFRLCV